MKSLSSRPRRNLNTPRLVLGLVVFGVFFFSGLLGSRHLDLGSRALSLVAAPALSALNNFQETFGQLFALFRPKSALIAENRVLLEKNFELKNKVLNYELLLAENEELRAAALRGEKKKLILSRVLSHPPESFYDTFLLDSGEEGGVSEGGLVFAGSVILGEISVVYPRSSLVRLFSSPGGSVSVRIGASNLPAEARGRGGGNFEAVLPKGAEVERGDLVYLSRYPKYVLGAVEAVEGGDAETLTKVLFRLPLNLSEVVWVEIENIF